MTNTARTDILNRLRKSRPTPKDASAETGATEPRLVHQAESDLHIELSKQLSLNRAQVVESTQLTLSSTLAELAREHAIRQLLVGTHPDFHPPCEHAMSSVDGTVLLYNKDYEAQCDNLFNEIDAGLTSVQAAVAETGTLVIIPSRDEPRMLSLAPPIHIAVVKSDCPVYANLKQLMHEPLWQKTEMPTNIIFVSSPSKTADIQQTLAYGAHGPRHFIVILLKD